jgi:acyl-CoA synthetase (NDP forming)
VIDRILCRGAGWATAIEAAALLEAAGIDGARSRVATDLDTALHAASVLGYPVALKAPEIQELDLNPVIVTETSACVADVRIRIGDRSTARSGRRVEY